MKKFLRTALMCAVVAAPFAAQAEDAYVKLGLGRSGTELAELGTRHQTGYVLAGGMAVDKNVDVEVGYIDFGKDTFTFNGANGYYKFKAFYAAGIGKYWVNDAVNVFGKLGIARLDLESNADAQSTNTETKVLYGVGTSYHFTKELSGLLEYTQYASHLDMLSASVRYSF